MNSIKVKSGYVLLIIVVLITFSCRNTKNASNNKQKSDESANMGSSDNYRLIVSFYSPGNGIDHDMKKEYLAFINDNYPNATFEEFRWGREGERDYCFQLNELDDNQKLGFVEESRELLSKSSRVNIKENEVCRHKR